MVISVEVRHVLVLPVPVYRPAARSWPYGSPKVSLLRGRSLTRRKTTYSLEVTGDELVLISIQGLGGWLHMLADGAKTVD